MKRIFIDASLAGRNDGTGRVSYNLTQSIIKLDRTNNYIILMYKEDIFPSVRQSNITKVISKWSARGHNIRALWYLFFLPILLYKYKADIYYGYEAFSTPLLFKGKTILTIHDIIPLKVKKYYRKLLNRAWFMFKVYISVRKPQETAVVSNFTKQEVEEQFPQLKDHTHIVYNALDIRFIKDSNKITRINATYKLIDSKFNIKSKKYFFSTGGLEERKNNLLTIRSYIDLLETNRKIDIDLVIIGVGNAAYINAKANKTIAIPKEYQNRIHFFHEVTNEELELLFANAYAFIFPSTYEGFGMPILEAMNYNIPVIALNTTSLPEVGGNACLYIENNPESMKKAMIKIISDKKLYNYLIQKGGENIKRFSWDKGACSIINIINKL